METPQYLEAMGEGPALAEAAAANTLHYSTLLAEAADAVMPPPSLPPGALGGDVFDELNRTVGALRQQQSCQGRLLAQPAAGVVAGAGWRLPQGTCPLW